jgi:hypothetical protein
MQPATNQSVSSVCHLKACVQWDLAVTQLFATGRQCRQQPCGQAHRLTGCAGSSRKARRAVSHPSVIHTHSDTHQAADADRHTTANRTPNQHQPVTCLASSHTLCTHTHTHAYLTNTPRVNTQSNTHTRCGGHRASFFEPSRQHPVLPAAHSNILCCQPCSQAM